MSVNLEKLEGNVVALEIEIEQAKMEQAMETAYQKVSKKVNIPGFRKGKAPRALVERHVGKEYLNEEALDAVLPKAFIEAVEETGIDPIDKPKVEVVQMEDGKPVIIKVTVEVKPEVELGDYIGLEVERENPEISDTDVENELESLRERHSQLINVEEGPAELKDITTIDFEGFVDGVAFPGGTGTDYSLELGSGQFIPGFEEQLVGAKVGEARDVNVAFPEDYHATELAGKDALFKVSVKAIKRKELAELDDEFAKDVSEFETLEELKKDILNRLKQAATQQADMKIKDALVEKAVENAKVEVPEIMIQQKIDTMLQNLVNQLGMQNLKIEDYLRWTNSDIDTVRAEYRPAAEKSVKVDLVLETIADKENIALTDEDVDAKIDEMAKQYNSEPGVLRQWVENGGNMEALKKSILIDKTVDMIQEKAVIK